MSRIEIRIARVRHKHRLLTKAFWQTVALRALRTHWGSWFSGGHLSLTRREMRKTSGALVKYKLTCNLPAVPCSFY